MQTISHISVNTLILLEINLNKYPTISLNSIALALAKQNCRNSNATLPKVNVNVTNGKCFKHVFLMKVMAISVVQFSC